MLAEYDDMFAERLGTIAEHQAKLHVAEGARPVFCKPRPVPFAMKEAVEEELNHLERMGVVDKVDSSDWAAPIVSVLKRNVSVVTIVRL